MEVPQTTDVIGRGRLETVGDGGRKGDDGQKLADVICEGSLIRNNR